MIELQDLSVGYRGEPVLRGVNLAFRPGQVTVLLGPNGCGKSTLLKTALGLLPALGGQVLYDGVPLGSLAPVQVARQAAYMAQSRSVPHTFPTCPFHGATGRRINRRWPRPWTRRARPIWPAA